MADPKALAEAATAPETFDFAATVLGRSYPEIDVPVYLDEATAQKMLALHKERDEVRALIVALGENAGLDEANRLDAIEKKYEKYVERLKNDRYIVKIKGISPERALELEEKAYEEFPIEYEETTSPITGAVTRTEKPNDKRDQYHSTLIRQAHLVSVTAPNGAVDTDFSDPAKVQRVILNLPLVARAKVDEAINEATIAVDYYTELVDEVF